MDDREALQQADRSVSDFDLERLYRREATKLALFFGRRLKDREDARDLVHDTFTRLASIRSGAALGNPGAFLQRIARNLLYDRYRQNRARAGLVRVPMEVLHSVSTPPSQSDGLEAAELLKAVESAVAELPPRTREVFLLHRREALCYRQISQTLGISIRTVEWHIYQALLRIGRALDDEAE